MIKKFQFISQGNTPEAHIQSIKKALDCGVTWVQLRIKNHTESEITKTAEKAKIICEAYEAQLIINDLPTVALKVNADGLHLGKNDKPVEEARQILGKDYIIGATANTFEDIESIAKTSANYIGLGPFRFTTTKEKLSPILGLDGYKSILEQCSKSRINLPIIAIGGINEKDISSIIKTGVFGIASSSLLLNHVEPTKVYQDISKILKESTLC